MHRRRRFELSSKLKNVFWKIYFWLSLFWAVYIYIIFPIGWSNKINYFDVGVLLEMLFAPFILFALWGYAYSSYKYSWKFWKGIFYASVCIYIGVPTVKFLSGSLDIDSFSKLLSFVMIYLLFVPQYVAIFLYSNLIKNMLDKH